MHWYARRLYDGYPIVTAATVSKLLGSPHSSNAESKLSLPPLPLHLFHCLYSTLVYHPDYHTMPSIIRRLLASKGAFSIPARYMATVAEASSSTASTSTSPSTSPSAETSSSSSPAAFSPFTRRCGLVARKRGMTTLWDQDGKQWPVTVLQVGLGPIVRKYSFIA